jgi:chromosome segregation ATPase
MTLSEKVKELQASLDEKVQALQGVRQQAEAQVADLEAKLAAVEAEKIEQAQHAAQLIEEKDECLAEAIKARDVALDEIQAAHEQLATEQARAEAAQRKLANPAFEDASLQGRDEPVDTSGDAEHSFVAEYYGIKDLKARVAFYNANRENILTELRQR